MLCFGVGRDVARAFTNAFVRAKVEEIQSQLDECLRCSCGEDGPSCELLPNANISACMRPAGMPAQHFRTSTPVCVAESLIEYLAPVRGELATKIMVLGSCGR